ncbi:DUF2274 domain-containing protein [Sphingomonas abietis]|uniref:DUF2274 domain-containing protein n=1 Tax=Sphingomonas abietis TaxID=3012344 RepID=A0ABY7NS56_9SPHN|nr:DUF2274 domain-containing protein [Sphingomonas abietis]WBO24338.1 DUF2274 domain-containing protein [Sphingomonas abietis]
MAELKLARLPDRTPVKISITVTPDLDAALRDYLAIYRSTYADSATTIADLIPAMLEAFLGSDKAFAKARKSHGGEG